MDPEPTGSGDLPAHYRASDADRDRVADVLREALAEGRLTPEEHSDRVDRVFAARTLGDLEPLIADLPIARPRPAGPPVPSPPVPSPPSEPARREPKPVVAVFGKARRRGRFVADRETTAVAVWGEVRLDLTEAVLEEREVVVNAIAIFGSVVVDLPGGCEARSEGFALFGSHQVDDDLPPAEPDAPVVRVRGFALCGEARARRRRRPWFRGTLDRG